MEQLLRLAPSDREVVLARVRDSCPPQRGRSSSTLDLEVDLVREEPPRRSPPPPLPPRVRPRVPRVPPAPPTPRVDPMDVARQAASDVAALDSGVTAGSVCVAAALRIAPALAGLLLLWDYEDGDFTVAYAVGPRAARLLLTSCAGGDAVVAAGARAGRPTQVQYGPVAAVPARHAHFGRPSGAVVVPVGDEGRCLGAIELVDPAAPLSAATSEALCHLATSLAGRLRQTGIVLANVVPPPAE